MLREQLRACDLRKADTGRRMRGRKRKSDTERERKANMTNTDKQVGSSLAILKF